MGSVEPGLLAQVRRSHEVLERAEHDAERARAEYYAGIRRLHQAGATLREVARAVEMSHQRVHQVVAEVSCRFCGRGGSEAAELVAGPGLFICNQCVALGSRLLARQRPQEPASTLGLSAEGAVASCSFCRRRGGRVGRMVEHGDDRICARCLGMSLEILAGRSSTAIG